MFRRVVAVVAPIAWVIACSSSSSSSGVVDGGADTDASAPFDCYAAVTEASKAVEDARKRTNTDCTKDEECTRAYQTCSCCFPPCGGFAISTASAADFDAARKAIEAKSCAPFQQAACLPGPQGEGRCDNTGAVPICANGGCTLGPPATWTSFSFVALAAEAEAGAGEERKVTPDGHLVVSDPTGESRAATLSAADLAQADAILRSVSFRLCEEQRSCSCGPMVVKRTAELSVMRGFDEYDSDASACADTPNGDLGTLYTIVHKY